MMHSTSGKRAGDEVLVTEGGRGVGGWGVAGGRDAGKGDNQQIEEASSTLEHP